MQKDQENKCQVYLLTPQQVQRIERGHKSLVHYFYIQSNISLLEQERSNMLSNNDTKENAVNNAGK
jgi:hypothetical protein